MIVSINEKQLDDFIKIRKDSVQLDPLAFGRDPDSKIDREEVRQTLRAKNEEDFVLLYYHENQLAGITGFFRYSKRKTRHKAFIWGVFVYQKFRGLGIARQLLEEAIRRGKRLADIEKINLTCSHTSEGALVLYQSLGFKEYGREIKAMQWEGQWIDEILMDLVL